MNDFILGLQTALIKSAIELDKSILDLIVEARDKEATKNTLESKASLVVLNSILENLQLSKKTKIPMCQDTGMFDVFVDIGRDNKSQLKDIETAIKKACALASEKGNYRKSVVSEPVFDRNNTKTNLPPIITYNLVEGKDIEVNVLLKGFGSENCCGVKMLNPTVGKEGVIEAVVDIVKKAGGKPCPPICVGIGLGGTMERAAYLSKRALIRDVSKQNDDCNYSKLEKEILYKLNETKIGSGGFGGVTTALLVQIEQEPTHIAGLPLAVSINCWADRKATFIYKGNLND
ncbi:MAG: fumarate hydratase [Pleomorphochaeta sp.]